MNTLKYSSRIFGIWLMVLSYFLVEIAVASDDFLIDVQGVKIVGTGYKNINENIMPFNQFSGVSIACLLLSKTEGIINFVEVKSKLEVFKDNLGTNLIDPESNFGNGFGLMHEISKDRSALLFEISGSNLPDKKATSLVSSGEIVVKTANNSNIFTVQNITLSKGTEIKTPFGEIEIKNVGKTDWGDHPYKVSIESKVNLSVIKNIKFTDQKGAVIESSSMGMGSLNEVGDISSLIFEKSFSITKNPTKINMEIIYWEDMKTKKIPFSISTSVGL